jgi:putative transposase
VLPGHGGRKALNAGATDLETRAASATFLSAASTGSQGFPEAIEAIYPQKVVQTCIVHLIRHSLRYVPRRSYDQVVKDLRPIYTAVDAEAARAALEAFEEKWGEKLPVIGQAWRNSWEYITPFLAFEPEVRRVVYTTNAIEALNRQLRKAINTKAASPARTPSGSSSTSRSRTPCRNDADVRLDEGATRVQDPLRGPTARLTHQPRLHR